MREPQNVDLRVIGVDIRSPDGTCDIIFVHGLDGDPVKTWQHDPTRPDLSFPHLLAADLSLARVWALGYPAQKFGGESARAMSIEDRAKSVLASMAADGFGMRRIVFIAHSLGGLLVKQMLRFAAETTADPDWRRIGEAVLGVVFLATPHAGADLARVANALRLVFGPSVATLDLQRYSTKLLNLREWYSDFSVRNSIETAAFAETRPLPVFGMVVSEESAWPGGNAKLIQVDNVNHIQIAQTPTREATVYKDALSSLRQWLARDEDPTQVPLDRETHESDSDEISRFLFRTRRVPLSGRYNDLQELQKFLDDPRSFTWCAVTGPGGSGKSRLALEFCLQVPPKWRAGFLKDWVSSDFRRWTPNRPTLVVIDYVSARAKDVGSIVRDMESRRNKLQFPVRIVLVERDARGSWVRDFVGAGEDRRATERGQYASFPADPLIRPDDPYDDTVHLRALALAPLTTDALWDCMSSVFDSIALTQASHSQLAGNRERLLARLLEIDGRRRPLFAAFFAEAIAADPSRIDWDVKALIESVLEREQRNFWTPNGVTEFELDLLTLATLVRGIDRKNSESPIRASDSAEFSPRRYSIACGVNASQVLSPLEPDMIGELFVLNRLRHRELWQVEELRDRAWEIDAFEMATFLSRAARDFPDHPALWFLGNIPRTESLRERYIWLRVAAEQLLPISAGNALQLDAVVSASSSWRHSFWEHYRKLISTSSDDGCDEADATLFAQALSQLAYTLGSVMADRECAIDVCDEIVTRFGRSAKLRSEVARALLNKASALGQLNCSEEAVAVCDEMMARFGETSELAFREPVADALFLKGAALGQLNRFEEAMAVFDEVARFDEAKEPALLKGVARALVLKGAMLRELDRLDEAFIIFDAVVARFAEAPGVELRKEVARALTLKASALRHLNRYEDAVTVYDVVLARFGEAIEPATREEVAYALVNKGATLDQLGRSEDAIAVYEEVVFRFSASAEPVLREQVARALVYKGATLSELHRSQDAILAYEEVLLRSGASEELTSREQVAWALYSKGVTLGQLGRPEDEIAVYDELVSMFGESAEPALRELVAGALVNKGATLGQLDRCEDAIAMYEEMVSRFGASGEPALREQVVRALDNKAATLRRLGRREDEIAVYEDVVSQFGASAELALREQVARALYNKGVTLGQLGRSQDAIAVYEEVVSRFGAAAETALREPVAGALVNKGATLGQLGRPEDEIAVYEDVVSMFGG